LRPAAADRRHVARCRPVLFQTPGAFEISRTDRAEAQVRSSDIIKRLACEPFVRSTLRDVSGDGPGRDVLSRATRTSRYVSLALHAVWHNSAAAEFAEMRCHMPNRDGLQPDRYAPCPLTSRSLL